MIDIEADVFGRVSQAVAELVPAGNFRSDFVPSVSKMPFATLIEVDNITDPARRDTLKAEQYAIVTYEANAWAQTKSEAKAIISAIDEALMEMNFTRVDMQVVPNFADRRLTRYVARYRAEVDRNKTIYRRP